MHFTTDYGGRDRGVRFRTSSSQNRTLRPWVPAYGLRNYLTGLGLRRHAMAGDLLSSSCCRAGRAGRGLALPVPLANGRLSVFIWSVRRRSEEGAAKGRLQGPGTAAEMKHTGKFVVGDHAGKRVHRLLSRLCGGEGSCARERTTKISGLRVHQKPCCAGLL